MCVCVCVWFETSSGKLQNLMLFSRTMSAVLRSLSNYCWMLTSPQDYVNSLFRMLSKSAAFFDFQPTMTRTRGSNILQVWSKSLCYIHREFSYESVGESFENRSTFAKVIIKHHGYTVLFETQCTTCTTTTTTTTTTSRPTTTIIRSCEYYRYANSNLWCTKIIRYIEKR